MMMKMLDDFQSLLLCVSYMTCAWCACYYSKGYREEGRMKEELACLRIDYTNNTLKKGGW